MGEMGETEIAKKRGATVPQPARQIRLTEQTYYPWRKCYSGLHVYQEARLKALGRED